MGYGDVADERSYGRANSRPRVALQSCDAARQETDDQPGYSLIRDLTQNGPDEKPAHDSHIAPQQSPRPYFIPHT